MSDTNRQVVADGIALMQRKLNMVVDAARTGVGDFDAEELDRSFTGIHERLNVDGLADEYRDLPQEERDALKIQMLALRDLSELMVMLGESPDEVMMVEVE